MEQEYAGDASSAVQECCVIAGETLDVSSSLPLRYLRARIEAGAIKVHELIKSDMGPYLTHDDPLVRRNAVRLVWQLLRREKDSVPSLPKSAISHLFDFFGGRMHTDFDSALPCMQCIHTLLKDHAYAVDSQKDIPKVVKSVFVSNHVPAMAQPIRQEAFALIETLLNTETYASELSIGGASDGAMEDSDILSEGFAKTFASSMEGEKDPRCLLVCLRLAGRICRLIPSDDIKSFERLFDVVSVYFPIAFTPPPNDPFGIRKEDLVEALTDVLVCRDEMAPFTLPIVLEASENEQDCADGLAALSRCASAFSPGLLRPHLGSARAILWAACVHSDDAKVNAAAMNCIKSTVKAISLAADENSAWEAFAEPLLKDCTDSIQESVDSLMGRASASILACAAAASPQGMSRALDLVSHLPSTIRSLPAGLQRVANFEVIGKILGSIDADVAFCPSRNPLAKVAPSMLAFLCESLRADAPNSSKDPHAAACARCAISCTRDILVRPRGLIGGSLGSELVESTANLWTELALSQTVHSSVAASASNAIVHVGIRMHLCDDFARVLKETIIPAHFDFISSREEDASVCRSALLTLVALGSIDSLREVVVPAVCARVLVQSDGDANALSSSIVCPMYMDALSLLFSKPSSGVASSEFGGQLMKAVWNAAGGLDRALAEKAVKCLRNFARSTDATALVPMLRECLVEISNSSEHLANSAVQRLADIFPFVCAVLGALKGSLNDFDLDEKVVPSLLRMSSIKGDLGFRASKCLGLLALRVSSAGKQILQSGAASDAKSTITALPWIIKGLAMKRRPPKRQLNDLVDACVDMLKSDSSQTAMAAACGFGVIVKKDSDFKGESSSPLFLQRFFAMVYPKLRAAHLAQPQACKDAVILSLSLLFESVRLDTLVEHIGDIFPVLVVALTAEENADARKAALCTFVPLFEAAAQPNRDAILHLFKIHLSSVLPVLLRIAQSSDSSAAASDRLAALKCIGLSARINLPRHEMLKHRDHIVRGLRRCLDDAKKNVRAVAVECRNYWILK